MKRLFLFLLILLFSFNLFSQSKMIINKNIGSADTLDLSNIKSITFKPYSPDPIQGLVAWYPFNGTGNDSSGNGINSTLNTASYTYDRNNHPNSALYFNGSSKFNANSSNKLSLSTMTLCAWIKGSTKTTWNPRVVAVGPATTSCQNYGLFYDNGYNTTKKIGFLLETVYTSPTNCANNNYYSLSSVDTLAWHHVAASYDGQKVRLYIDGNMDKDTTVSLPIIPISDALVQIGYSDNNEDWFRGAIDDVRIYNRALSDGEIKSIFQH